MIEVSGSGAGSESIPVHLTNGYGSGSRRPKNIRIRIRNTCSTDLTFYFLSLKNEVSPKSNNKIKYVL